MYYTCLLAIWNGGFGKKTWGDNTIRQMEIWLLMTKYGFAWFDHSRPSVRNPQHSFNKKWNVALTIHCIRAKKRKDSRRWQGDCPLCRDGCSNIPTDSPISSNRLSTGGAVRREWSHWTWQTSELACFTSGLPTLALPFIQSLYNSKLWYQGQMRTASNLFHSPLDEIPKHYQYESRV